MSRKHYDQRSEEMKEEMARHFAENEAEYRDSEWSNVVFEDEEVVIIEDTKGYEFAEWKDEYGNEEFSTAMHELAAYYMADRWGSTYPVVFDKLEGEE